MSVGITTAGSGKFLGRNASFNPAANWTISFWYRVPAAPSAGNFINQLLYGDPALSNPYLDLFVQDTNQIAIEAWDGAVSTNTGLQAVPSGWMFLVAQYNAATTTLTLQKGDIDSAVGAFGSLVVNLAGFVFVETKEQILGDSGTSTANNIAYHRVWQRLLSGPEIEAERLSASAVLATNLEADTPLLDNTDLADDSGGGNNWTATGAITSFSSPFYDAGSSLPFNLSVDANAGGVTSDIWVKYVSQPGDTVIGGWLFGDLVTYLPRTSIYVGANPTVILLFLNLEGPNLRVQFPVTPGTTYWLKATPNAGNPSPAVLTINIERAPNDSFQNGDIFVNDDTEGFPAAILSPTVDNEVRKFIVPFPNGEAGDILHTGPNAGVNLVEDFANNNVVVYAADFTTIIATIADGTSPRIRTVHGGVEKFYVAKQSLPAVKYYTVTAAGVKSAEVTMTGITSVSAIAANNSETILYHSDDTNNSPIRRWDITGGVALSNLAAVFGANQYVSDILVLDDDTIIVLYSETVGLTVTAVRYNAAGAILNTYNLGITAFPAGTRPRLAYALDNPNSFHVWIHQRVAGVTLGISRFINIKCSDGSTIDSVDHQEYETGVYNSAVTATPSTKFGNSFSCPFFIIPLAASTGTIIVEKVTVPADATLFDINTVNLTPSTYQLSNGQNRTHSGLTPASNYEVSETPNALYDTVITVSNGSPANAISVAAGETVTVTITNTLKSVVSATILVLKMTDPLNLAQLFEFAAAGGSISPTSFGLHSEETILFHVAPGTYSIIENAYPNFRTTYMIDNDPNNDNENIVVGAGENVSVGVLNESFGGGLSFPDPTPPGGNTFPPGTGKPNDGVPGQGNTAIPTPFFETAFVRDT